MASMASTVSKLSHHLPHFSTSISPPKTPSLYGHSPKTTLSFSSSIQSYATITFCKRNEKMSPLVVSAGVRHLTGSLTRTEGLRFAVVVARFNEVVTKLLLDGALDTFKKYSVGEEDIDVVWVPGSFEVPLVAERLGKLRKYHAVLCIGAVIRGDTSHYDAVANLAASGVLTAGLNSGVPCIFGVLTCDDLDQALNRAGGKSGNKGSEAALTAIEMASLFEHYLK